MFEVYIHVPFCMRRCGYCDFNTYTAVDMGAGASRGNYANMVIREMSIVRDWQISHGIDEPEAATVFFGGGTPTILKASDLVAMLNAVRDTWGIADNAEITTEANPDTVNADYVRELARKLGFYNADKPDSQDICFVPDGDYASFIRSFTGRDYPRGEFVDKSGNVLGEHRGLIGYTVGQRKGLGIALGEPRYVTALMSKENRVVLGSNEDLMGRELDAKNFNFIAFDTPPAEFRASARVRYRQAEQPATVRVTGENTVHITFDEPQRAITKGQAVVVYDGDVVIGGGEIC